MCAYTGSTHMHRCEHIGTHTEIHTQACTSAHTGAQAHKCSQKMLSGGKDTWSSGQGYMGELLGGKRAPA
jgi:hypothetical protein